MQFLRVLLAALLAASCAAAAARAVIPRFRCDVEKTRIQAETSQLNERGMRFDRVRHSREMIAVCQRCLELFPHDYHFEALLAANLHLLGLDTAAEESYKRAIALNERPELYARLAVVQLGQQKLAEARRNLVIGSMFSLTAAEYVEQPLQGEVSAEVTKRHDELRAKRQR
jgi:hypothetical protein